MLVEFDKYWDSFVILQRPCHVISHSVHVVHSMYDELSDQGYTFLPKFDETESSQMVLNLHYQMVKLNFFFFKSL